MPRTREFSDSDMIAALTASNGRVYEAAQVLGCSPRAIYKRRKVSEEVNEAIDGARGYLLDIAEMKLIDAVKAGEAWAICFFLKTQGKHRGYTERQEVREERKIVITLPESLRKRRDSNAIAVEAAVEGSLVHS